MAPGMAADLVLWRLDGLAMAGGAVHDPLAALLLCASPQADWVLVDGQVLLHEGQLTTLDLRPLIERHNRLAVELVNRAG
jgi:8-oxoguanine deaminase